MISVCYLSSTRRRRARSRWCWAPAPGGCWMWLGRERRTTKTTAWCTAKVSGQLWHPVISLQSRAARQSSIHPSSASLPQPLSLRFLFCFPSPHISKSQTFASNCVYTAARTRTKRRAKPALTQRVIYITKTLIKSWETSLDTQS